MCPEGLDRALKPLNLRGFQIYKSYLDETAQRLIVSDMRDVVAKAPLFSPKTRFGKAMSVRMTSAGRYGWYSDSAGYRYIKTHPNGDDWPEIPASVTSVWADLVGSMRLADCCLANFYDQSAKMGLHQDNDEADFTYPVVSISLGDSALFRVGDTQKGGPTSSVWLTSGDVVVMGGDARLAYHGIDKIKFGSSSLLLAGGRLNLTLRVVD